MPQRIIEERGKKLLLIEVSIRCKNHPSGRITRKRRLDNLERGSTKANKIERELLEEVQKEKGKREVLGVSWGKLVSIYESVEYPNVLEGNHSQNKQTFNDAMFALRKYTTCWNDIIAGQITAMDVQRLFYEMKASEISDSKLRKVRGDIKKVFEFGILHRHVQGMDRSPTTGIAVKGKKNGRTEILSEEEVKKLLKYAKQYEPAWFFIWSFAVYTGARNGELYALKWSDVDEKERIITIQRSYNRKYDEYKGTKTDEWRKVSINDPLLEILQDLKKIREHEIARGNSTLSEYVLPRPGVWQSGMQALKLRQFCEEVGITPICFHTLRACFATELLKRGVPIPRVMRVGGWKSLKTMMYYVRLAGIEDKGITDPLDFRTEDADPKKETASLLQAVGKAFTNDLEAKTGTGSVASVIPLASRRHPGLLKP